MSTDVLRFGDGARAALVLALSVCLTLCFGAAAAAEPFAGLSITASGRQLFDITTGMTILPDGGVVTDKATGVELVAGHIEYLAGQFVEAIDAEVSGDFGAVSADLLVLDLEAGVLEASGDLRLVREGLSIRAGTLVYDAHRQVAVFGGGVVASGPTFEADRLLLDATTGDVLLVGQYLFEDTLFTMTSPEAGGQLELKLVLRDGETFYDAATEVSPTLLARFEGLL